MDPEGCMAIYIFVCSEINSKKQHISILVFGLTRTRLESTIYHTRCEHGNKYTTYVVNTP
jgi:hypothetical protein